MDITIRELLKMESFEKAYLLAGEEGIDNNIKHINAMEIPNISSWLSEGELLITTGYAIKNDTEKLKEIIVGLYKASSAGLAIKTKFIGPIAEEILVLADTLKIPVILIPDDISFVSITTPIIKRLVEKQETLRNYYRKIHDIFMELELNGGTIEDISEMIMKLTNLEVIIWDCELNIIGTTNFSEDNIIKILDELNVIDIRNMNDLVIELEIDENTFIFRKIRYKNKVCGIICVKLQNGYDKLLNIVLDHASTVIALEYSKKEAIKEYNSTLDNMFFLDIMSGNIKTTKELEVRSESLDWPNLPYVPVYFDIKEFSKYSLSYNEIELYNLKMDIVDIMKKEFNKIVDRNKIFLKSDNFSCILAVDKNDSKINKKLNSSINEIINKVYKEYSLKITAGIGNEIYYMDDLKREFENAKMAMEISRKLKNDRKYSHIKDVQFEHAIIESTSKVHLDMFISNTIGRLKLYDEKNNSELLKTLKVYVFEGENVTVTAQKLFIHRNTVNYRLNQIVELLGINIDDREQIVNLIIAFRLDEILN